MNKNFISNLVIMSISDVLVNDEALFMLNVHEGAISHRLAYYLEKNLRSLCPNEFKDVFVDCEYNRFGSFPDSIKELPGLEKYLTGKNQDRDEKIVRPDIVLHKRQSKTDKNFLVIEIKKISDDDYVDGKQYTKDKVVAFVNSSRYSYAFGLYLEFKAGFEKVSPTQRVNSAILFSHGVNGGIEIKQRIIGDIAIKNIISSIRK